MDFTINAVDVQPKTPTSFATAGLACGQLRDAEEGNVNTFRIRTPNVFPPGSHLRIVLTWDSNPTAADNLLSDLDLVFRGNGDTHITTPHYNRSVC